MTSTTGSTGSIFLHSSFRTSSTWLGGKLRAQTHVMAFYEPFNEFLGEATEKTLFDRRPDNWQSGHTSGAPYFLEYRPLVTSRSGLEGYHPDFAFHRFIPENGITGKISEEESQYIRQLIKLAAAHHKTPSLAFTRSLGRLAGIKKEFGGTHIFLYRSLFDQWMSYMSLQKIGEVYFIQTLGRILRLNSSKVPLFQKLIERYWVGEDTPGNFVGFSSHTDAFEAFLGIHLYLYAHSAAAADISISARRLSSDPLYQEAISDEICRHTGIQIDLGDASRSVQFMPLSFDLQAIEKMSELVISYLRAEGTPYAESLILELSTDLKLDVALAASCVGYLHREVRDVQQLLADQCLKTQSMKSSMSSAHEEIRHLQTSLENARNAHRAEIQEFVSSRSWKLTLPLRLLNGLVQARRK